MAGTSQCYQCLQGRPDYCRFTFFSNAPGVEAFPPFADMRDGTRGHAQAGIGGMSEIMTAFEEYCVPIFSDLPAAELTLLLDQLASGFAAGLPTCVSSRDPRSRSSAPVLSVSARFRRGA